MTALERFEQAFGPSYRTGGYRAINVRTGATIYFNGMGKNRCIASINLRYVWNFPNAHSLVSYLEAAEVPHNARDYRIGSEHWEWVIHLIQQ